MDNLDALLVAPYDEALIPCPYVSAHPTGSRFTCTPAVITTDEDWLVYVMDLEDADRVLSRNGFGLCGIAEYEGSQFHWMAFRRGTVNLIVTDDKEFYLREVAATLLAAKLNLLHKKDRVDLFRCITGEDPRDPYDGPVP